VIIENSAGWLGIYDVVQLLKRETMVRFESLVYDNTDLRLYLRDSGLGYDFNVVVLNISYTMSYNAL